MTQVWIFLIYILVIGVVVEIGTVMLRYTGLPFDVARFQAISLLTGTGFTTGESEQILKNSNRRKIATFLILTGTVAFAFLTSILVSFFIASFNIEAFLTLGLGMIPVFLIFRFKKLWQILDKKTEERLSHTKLHDENVTEFLAVDENASLFVINLPSTAPITNKSLRELRLRDKGLVVLAIVRNNKTISPVRGDDELFAGDRLVTYGSKEAIVNLIGNDQV